MNINIMLEYKKLEIKRGDIEKIKKTMTHNVKKLSNNLVEMRSILAVEQHKLNDYTLKETEKSVLELIINTLDKNGLIDNILSKTIMPKLTCDVNELLCHIADYKIDIQYNKGRFKILKIHNNSVINIDTLSGCEKFIANIAFKLALDGYNNYIKTKFIIVDEVFTCCDDDNIAKLPSLFNYIKKHYQFAMIISHDDRIKKLYDSEIGVAKRGLYSYIFY
jgi:DNA repair exonuclease SbcCD ATPase subunit